VVVYRPFAAVFDVDDAHTDLLAFEGLSEEIQAVFFVFLGVVGSVNAIECDIHS